MQMVYEFAARCGTQTLPTYAGAAALQTLTHRNPFDLAGESI